MSEHRMPVGALGPGRHAALSYMYVCDSHLQEKDDLRKRKRQERLNELRTGTRKDWVQLQRENPAFEG